MKEQKTQVKTSFFKKIFIKICRIFGYEIIDQSNFYIPTQEKNLSENLNIPGKKSITLPLGEVKISRKVNALTIIFRSCTNINMLTQNKKRLFDQNKSEYTFRSLNSIIASLNQAKITFPKIEFDIVVIDYNSKKEDLEQIEKQLGKSNFKNSMISLDISEFINNIKKILTKYEFPNKILKIQKHFTNIEWYKLSFLSRFSFIPFGITNLLWGITEIDYYKYLLTTLFGSIIFIFFECYIGHNIKYLTEIKSENIYIIIFSIIFVIFILYYIDHILSEIFKRDIDIDINKDNLN